MKVYQVMSQRLILVKQGFPNVPRWAQPDWIAENHGSIQATIFEPHLQFELLPIFVI